MNLSRPSRTFADYAAVAVCPVLIMLVVGSLVFFLVEIGYGGSQVGHLRWTLFWFVLAMVLVSRIAIEKGYAHAGVYGVGLAAATAIMLLQYVGNYLGVWFLLGLIWWATNKLTWDCTVIDDDQDASGEGLLQAAKLDPQDVHPLPASIPAEPALSASPVPGHKPPAKSKPAKPTWWKAMFGKRSAGSSQPHAPGLWVIYFSLGALSVFGLGQGLIPVRDVVGRRYGFILLCIYLAAALGLLLLTSFLGLRRYLRQRHLEMPPAMSATWITMGSAVGLAILICCILLPRPNADWSLTAMINRLGDPSRKSSEEDLARSKLAERAWANDQTRADDRGAKGAGREARGEGQEPGGERSKSAASAPSGGDPWKAAGRDSKVEGQESKESKGEGQQATGKRRQSSERQTGGQTEGEPQQNRPGEKQERGQKSPSSARASEQVKPQATPAPPALPVSPRAPLRLVRTALYAALGLLILFVIWKNRERLLGVVREFCRALQEFWKNLFTSRQSEAPREKPSLPEGSTHPFAAFSNPFASSEASQRSLQELIVYSFNGLEAWATERRYGRRPDQTPFEFAELLGEQVPELAFEVRQVTRLYVQVAFAKASSLAGCEPVLEALWNKLNSAGLGLVLGTAPSGV